MITVTEQAVAKLKELLAEQDDPNLCFRIFVTRGGCDGFSYGMTFDSSPEADDYVVEQGGVRLLVGAKIDYVSTVTAAGFTIYNPNAVSTCGCGHSFRTRDDAGAPDPCGEAPESGA